MSNNVHIERIAKIWRFWKFKIFWIFDAFCNQNDLNVKIWVFAKSAHQNTKSCRNKRTSSYRGILFSGRGQVVLFRSPTIFGRYSAGKINFGQICWCMHQQKFFKIDFFRFLRNCMKCILNVIYTLKNVFKHLWGHFPAIFDHIIMIKAFSENDHFLKKIVFFGIFAIFWLRQFWFQKSTKMLQNCWKLKNR